jgi:acyl carrier protein
MEVLIEQLLDIFEIEEVDLAIVLRELDLWDSLSVISLLAVLDETYGINIGATELAEVFTVADLFTFVELHRKK